MPVAADQQAPDRGHIQIPRKTYQKVRLIASIQDRAIGAVAADLIEKSIASLPKEEIALSAALSN